MAGLATDCYTRMNGHQTRVFELHYLPGGLCTSWECEDYVINGCFSDLYDTRDGKAVNSLWRELGVYDDQQIIQRDEFIQVRGEAGRQLIAFANPQRMEDHLLALFPADKKPIRALAKAVNRFKRFDLSVQ